MTFGIWSCAECGKTAPATVHQLRQTYCSKECMARGYSKRMVGASNPNFRAAGKCTCAQCGAGFVSLQMRPKFCSRACYYASRILPPKPPKPPRVKKEKPPKVEREVRRAEGSCLVCGEAFTYYKSRPRLYCSYACHLADGGAFRAGLAATEARMKYGAKKDANHKEVIEVMQEMCPVYDLSNMGHGLPDGIAWINGCWQFFDIKNPKTSYGRKGLNPIQEKWIKQWKGGPVFLIYTAEEAQRFCRGEFDGIKRVERQEEAA